MPTTIEQRERSLHQPAFCELLPVRDILHDIIVRTTGAFVAGYELSGITLPPVTTTTVYDAYGNATSIVASTGDGYSKTTINTYIDPPDTTNWFIGRLIRSSVRSETP